jgi:nicotinamide-nucleotide amidase
MTREVVAAWGGVPLTEDPQVKSQLAQRRRKRGLKSPAGADRQSQVPEGLTPVTNPVGSAPALVGCLRKRTLVLLPGVPQELQGLLEPVIRQLEKVLPPPRPTRLWRTAQVAELTLVKICTGIRARYDGLDWSWWLTDWGVDMRLALRSPTGDPADLAAAAAATDALLGHLVYSRKPESLPQVVQGLLLGRSRTLAVAESCTAGLIGGRLTDLPGSSGFFKGGILAYADDVKHRLLGVPSAILRDKGAVSRETVAAMAAGCRDRIGTDYALAVSGISGPGGGTDAKPVGTTWVAVATPVAVFSHRYRFPADRERNRLLTVAAAVDSLRRVLQQGDDQSPWRSDDTWCRGS